MEKKYSRSNSRKSKLTSASHSIHNDVYKYKRVKLPLILQKTLKKQKSASDYSTPSPSNRSKQEYYEKSIFNNNSMHKQKSVSSNLTTERQLDKSKNGRMKQQQLLLNYQRKHLNKPSKFDQITSKVTPNNEDNDSALLQCSINTSNTEPILKKNNKIFEFNNFQNCNKDVLDFGQSCTLKTSGIFQNYQKHIQKYQTQHVKLIPPHKLKPKQYQMSRQIQRIKDLHKRTNKSMQKYIEYKKIRIQNILNKKLLSQMANYNKTKRNTN